jgi:hypothetical protein
MLPVIERGIATGAVPNLANGFEGFSGTKRAIAVGGFTELPFKLLPQGFHIPALDIVSEQLLRKLEGINFRSVIIHSNDNVQVKRTYRDRASSLQRMVNRRTQIPVGAVLTEYMVL